MNSHYILSIDQGTTGSTALVFDAAAHVVGRAYSEFTQQYPQPGWVEHDATEIWEVTKKVALEAISKARLTPGQISSIGITNQRETTVVWDRKTSEPIHNAIVWQCRRTADVCEKLKKKGHEKAVRKKTGLIIDAYFSATKVAWILDHVKGARKRAEQGELAFGTIDSWLLWKLTDGKVHSTDYTNASRTLLFDIHRKEWDTSLCKLFRVPTPLLPQVQNSSGGFGTTAFETFGASIPIRGMAGDQQSALFGHYAVKEGQGKCTFGTGAFALVFLGKRSVVSKNGLLTTLVCDAAGKPAYGLEGSIFMAGAIVQWLRDGLQIISKASETEGMALSVSDAGGVTLVPAFVGLGAPYWDSNVRAALLGMTRGTTKSHIARAALEAIANQTDDLVHAMGADTKKSLKDLRVDGGAVANHFLMQTLSDTLGIPVSRPSMIETTAFGAARLAAITHGLWMNEQSDDRKSENTFIPKMRPAERKSRRTHWLRAVAAVRAYKF